MAGSFETSDSHSDFHQKPLRVAGRIEGVFEEARHMVESLSGWTIVRADEAAHTLVCTRRARLLGGESTVTIRLEGPEGIPSTTVHVRSESAGGLLSHDRANVLEFLRPLHRRVC